MPREYADISFQAGQGDVQHIFIRQLLVRSENPQL